MKVVRLNLKNFRNIPDATIEPDSQLNFFLGNNGQGKTSVVEALAYLSSLRSFKGAATEEVIRWGEVLGEVECTLVPENTVEGALWSVQLRVVFQQHGTRTSKTAFINGKPYRSATQFLSQRFGQVELGFHTVVFNPSDHDLVRGDPSGRRQYLDRVLAAQDLGYLEQLSRYQRLLEQRNAILKQSEQPQPHLLAGFTEPMAESAAWITQKRLEYFLNLSECVTEKAKRIAPNQLELSLCYLSNWVREIEGLSKFNNDLGFGHFTGHPLLPSLELLEQSFWEKLSFYKELEWKTRSTLVGPHRDDWAFSFSTPQLAQSRGQLLKGHGSQGEIRSALLALKLSEIEIFRKKTGHRPVLLLDDFSSELDSHRRGILLEYLSQTDLQVFVTSTDDPVGSQKLEKTMGKKFNVSNGKITYVDQPCFDRVLGG